MMNNRELSEEEDEGVGNTNINHLEIISLPNGGNEGGRDGRGSTPLTTPFDPNRELSDPTTSGSSPSFADAPEMKLILLAFHLSIIEKAASLLGQLAFIWATVVLLGGFASALNPNDFWFVTAILFFQGARNYSHSRELQWQHHIWMLSPATSVRLEQLNNGLTALSQSMQQHQSIMLFTANQLAYKLQQLINGSEFFTPQLMKIWQRVNEVIFFPYINRIFVSKKMSNSLQRLQGVAAMACVALSFTRLITHDYGDEAQKNGKSALIVFYSIAFAEAIIYFYKKPYWDSIIINGKLIEQVSEECEIGPIGMDFLRRFFYDAYSRCFNGSVFDGFKMDLVSFAEELLNSNSPDKQNIGARILQQFVENNRFAGDTLHKIGSSTPVIERLIEMLSWKDPAEENIRRSASEIVSRLASKKQHALRVAAIPGAMESIASLLHTETDGRPYEASPSAVVDYQFSAFNLLGLLILKRLARDQDNCWKIGNARGLLERIIDLTSTGPVLLRDERAPESCIKPIRLALQVMKNLVCATGETGKILRKDISKIVYSISNIRDLLQYGESHPKLRDLLQYGESHLKLQMLGVEILTSLGMNEEAREKIGATGSSIRLILAVFFRPIITEEVAAVCNEAGEALTMLILESRKNCERLLRVEDDVVGRMVFALDNPMLRVNAMRILRGLCAYSAPERYDRLQIVAKVMPMVLKTIMEEKEKEKLLEASIGLALQILKFRNPEVSTNEIKRVGINDEDFVKKLVEILRRYDNPESKVPGMRRFAIRLAITLMKCEQKYIVLFRDLGMEQVLMRTAETTSELECFNVFYGSVGSGRHEVMISSLIDIALELLSRDGWSISLVCDIDQSCEIGFER